MAMDQAAIRERRAARDHGIRRRRRSAAAGLLVVLVVAVAVLIAGGADAPRAKRPAERAAGSAAAGAAAPAAHPRAKRPAERLAGSAPAIAAAPAAHPRAKRPAERLADSAPAVAAAPAAHAGATPGQARTTMPGAHLAAQEPVAVLMYHVIGVLPPGAPNPGLWVSAAELTAQVDALARAGYHGVTLEQVWNAWHRGGKLPRRPIVVSFDDGYTGHVRDALPALSAVGWPGVLNLELANLKDVGGTKAVKRLIRAGWEIASHTLTHPDLTTLGAARLREEVRGSRTRLRRLLGVAVRFFCYPSGRYDSAVIAAVKDAGYRGATTVAPGWASPSDDPYALPRLRVDRGTSAAALLQRVRSTRPPG
jgi:peptidoglycan/xylan/chitin deacetylase (PgdA/CDA1 family)